MKLLRHALAPAAAAALLLVAAPSAAHAAQVEHDRFLDSGTEVFDDFCGIDGVVYDYAIWVNHRANGRGKDQLVYFGDTVHGRESYTNPLTGASYVHTFNDVIKDWKITRVGTDRLRIETLGAGGDKWFSSRGNLRFQDTGTVRFAVIVDHGGTPTDPSDDEVVEELGVTRASTGRNDTDDRDFCEDFHLATD